MKIFGCPIGSEYLSTISHYFEFLICGFGTFISFFFNCIIQSKIFIFYF